MGSECAVTPRTFVPYEGDLEDYQGHTFIIPENYWDLYHQDQLAQEAEAGSAPVTSPVAAPLVRLPPDESGDRVLPSGATGAGASSGALSSFGIGPSLKANLNRRSPVGGGLSVLGMVAPGPLSIPVAAVGRGITASGQMGQARKVLNDMGVPFKADAYKTFSPEWWSGALPFGKTTSDEVFETIAHASNTPQEIVESWGSAFNVDRDKAHYEDNVPLGSRHLDREAFTRATFPAHNIPFTRPMEAPVFEQDLMDHRIETEELPGSMPGGRTIDLDTRARRSLSDNNLPSQKKGFWTTITDAITGAAGPTRSVNPVVETIQGPANKLDGSGPGGTGRSQIGDSEWSTRSYEWDDVFGDDDEDDSSNDGGCFISTAVVSHMGFDDKCWQLQALRWYRDSILGADHPKVVEYYDTAPGIVQRLNALDNSADIYRSFYHDYLAKALAAICAGRYSEALSIYENMVKKAKELAYG